MQDDKDALEVDDILQSQLPWSIKRLIFWLVLYLVIGVVGTAPFGFVIAYFNHVNGWGLTVQEIGHIGYILLYPVVILAALAFLRWQCEKVGLSIKAIWGSRAPQVRYIIFALTLGALLSLLWNWKIVNFDNPPKFSSDMIFYGKMIISSLLTPFLEELYFRGLLYRTLRKQNDSVISNLTSALIFSAMHVLVVDVTGFFFVFLYGVVTASLVERTNSLTASFLLHVIANLVHVVVVQHREFLLL